MKTTIHFYSLNLTTPGHADQYAEIKRQIAANSEGRGKWMKCISTPEERAKRVRIGTEAVEIETAHIFENQWNTPTDRVFDWYEEAVFIYGREDKNVRRGHWLSITPEMAALRAETCKCGYCGKLYGPKHAQKPEGAFCTSCLGSEYLKESELHLLRLVPVLDDWKNGARFELNADERAELLPRWQEMRRSCDAARMSAARKREKANIEKDLHEFKTTKAIQAQEKHDGLLWIWEKGFSTNNWIYYSHTRTFYLGWREPVSDDLLSRWLDVASDFPFNYEVKAKTPGKSVSRMNETATA